MVNLVSCVCKKSISVTKKVLKYGSVTCGLLGIIAILIYGVWSIRDIIVSIWNSCMGWVISILSDIWLCLCSIPWFVYVIMAIPICIIVYSTFWCIIKNYPYGRLATLIYKKTHRWVSALVIMFSIGIIMTIPVVLGCMEDVATGWWIVFALWSTVVFMSILLLSGAFDDIMEIEVL